MRKILCILLVAGLLVCAAVTVGAEPEVHSHCLCATGSANGCDHSALTWLPWDSADTLPMESGSYYLTQDVQLQQMYLLSGDADIKLCLNGHTVTGTNKVEEQIIYICGGANFSISDCVGTGKLTGSANGGLVVKDESPVGSTMSIYGGTVTGNHSIDHGGGIYVKYGTLNLYGGVVENNTTADMGGGVYGYGNGSAINLCSTVIRNNKATYGGGIAIRSYCKLTLESGQVSDNEATKEGGGVHCGIAYVNMKGATVSGNSAKEGGGFHVGGDGIPWQKDTFVMSGGTISGNKAEYAGGLYVQCMRMTWTGGIIENNIADQGAGVGTGTTLLSYISGITVRNNKATKEGGGIYFHSGSQTFLSDSTFTGNEAGENGGGIWVDDEVHFEDLTVTGNKAGQNGGGIYFATPRYDGESYLSGFFLLGGDMQVTQNQGSDVYVAEGAFVNMPAQGLSDNAKVGVTLASGTLTKTVFGSYNFEGKDNTYTLTKGDASLSQMKVQPQEPDQPSNSIWLILGVVALVIVIAVVAARTPMKKKTDKEAE